MAESGAGRVRLQHFNVMLSLTHYMPVRKLQSVVKMFALNHKVREWCVESSSFLTWVTQTWLLSWLYSRQTRVWDLVIRPRSRDQIWLALLLSSGIQYLGFLESCQLDESDSSCSLVQVRLTKSSWLDSTRC